MRHEEPDCRRTDACCSAEKDGCAHVPRRAVLAAAGAAGAVGLLAACGSSFDTDSATPSTSPDESLEPETTPSSSGTPDTTTDLPTNSDVVGFTGNIPVGGVTVVESRGILVAQPSEGVYRAFKAACPHQGCFVSDTEGQDLLCPCHGSLFSSQTGAVLRGPAGIGLTKVKIKVYGDKIVAV
jgi:Rieske Fe-S protein